MYKFEVRKGYGSDKFLIEFETVPNEDLLIAWREVAMQLDAVLTSTEDVWMNDEVFWNHVSSVGDFFLTTSIWDISFIMTNESDERNNLIIGAIAKALTKSGKFMQVPAKNNSDC